MNYNNESVETWNEENAETFSTEIYELTASVVSSVCKETSEFYTTTELTSATTYNNIESMYVGLYNAQTMDCLYSNASTHHIYPASLIKILTACTALNYVSPDTIFTVGTEQELVPEWSSLCLIQPGHSLRLRDLLSGMLISSGNDAAYTIAVNVAREVSGYTNMSDYEAVTYFSELMNFYAWSLGAINSNFINPDGSDDKNQYSTIYDLALISAHAIQIEEIRNIVSAPSKYVVFETGENITWENTNLLIQPDSEFYLPQAIGLKTGTTDNAGNCLIAVVNVDGEEYVAIVAGCKSDSARYETVHELIKLIK